MSAAGEKLAELIKAGDALAEGCHDRFADRGDLATLAARWTELRGEVHHEAHLLLDELASVVRRARGGALP